MRSLREFLALFSKKFFHDALPVAFASLLGALVLTYMARTDQVQPQAHAAAGEEMVRLVHEEHSLIVDFLRQQARKQEAEVAAQTMDSAAEKAASARRTAQADAVPLPMPRATAMRLAAEQNLAERARAEAKLTQAAQPLTQPVVLAAPAAPQQPAETRRSGIRDTVRGLVTGTRDAAATVWNNVTGGLIERVRLPELPAMPDVLPRRDFQARM